MFSSFFGKTKPINYFVLSGLLLSVYAIQLFFTAQRQSTSFVWILELLAFGALLLTILIIKEMVRTEKVTNLNSYAMLFFALLTMAFSETLSNKDVLFANFFLVLSTWRLLAIKSMWNVKHKIFDATFSIGLASLFLDWSLIYLVLVFAVINLFDRKTFKNWLVPFMALATLFILIFSVITLNGNLDFFQNQYQFSLHHLKEGFRIFSIAPKTIVYLVVAIVLIVVVFARARTQSGGKLVTLRIVVLAFIMGVLLFFVNLENPSTIMVTFAPAAIFLANFIEGIKRNKIREAVLVLSILLPLALLLFRFIR